MRLTNNTPAS